MMGMGTDMEGAKRLREGTREEQVVLKLLAISMSKVYQIVITDLLGRTLRQQFQHNIARCCYYCRRYCLHAVLWIITGLWPNAFSLGWALPPDIPDLLCGFVLSILSLLCKLYEIW